MLDLVEDLTTGRRDEASAYTGCVNEILPSIKANDYGVKTKITRDVAPDDELLAKADAMLTPEAAPLPWLVNAVATFGDHALKTVMTDKREHFGSGSARL